MLCEGMDWSNLVSKEDPVAGFCKYGNSAPDFMKARELLSNCRTVKSFQKQLDHRINNVKLRTFGQKIVNNRVSTNSELVVVNI
jgi:hypothetical protein